MESCDNCNGECKHLSDCLDLIYNDMLQRCNINYKTDNKTTPEHTYEQTNNGLGEGIKFERIRRCTGYLSGDYQTRFNNAKRAEVEDRIASNKYSRVEQYHEVNNE